MTCATVEETTEKCSTAKFDTIRGTDRQMQKLWTDLKVFELDVRGHTTNK